LAVQGSRGQSGRLSRRAAQGTGAVGTPSEAMPLEVGSRLGHYDVTEAGRR
jgi:hypothetical protein